jgi:hypothetical protein
LALSFPLPFEKLPLATLRLLSPLALDRHPNAELPAANPGTAPLPLAFER